MTGPTDDQKETIENPASTGLPLFRTWPAVYAFVLSVFVLTVILLIIFSRAFS